MVVRGLASIDYVLAIEEYRVLCLEAPSSSKFSLKLALQSIVKQSPKFDTRILDYLSEAVICLQKKSQSMFLGSTLFKGCLRTDLIFLYYFCRVMDDLVDSPDIVSDHDTRYWITQCSKALDAKFNGLVDRTNDPVPADPTAVSKFQALQSSLDVLPLRRLSKQPLYDLLQGFEMDLNFNAELSLFPIQIEADLDRYAYCVASTVAILVLNLVYHYHYPDGVNNNERGLENLKQAGADMGKALQCVNIARDIGQDAAIKRVYIPTSWLTAVGLKPSGVIQCPTSPEVYRMQQKMLGHADAYYNRSRAAIEELPVGARGPIRATVESYFKIGRVLRSTKEIRVDGEKLWLPLWRRLVVTWLAM